MNKFNNVPNFPTEVLLRRDDERGFMIIVEGTQAEEISLGRFQVEAAGNGYPLDSYVLLETGEFVCGCGP